MSYCDCLICSIKVRVHAVLSVLIQFRKGFFCCSTNINFECSATTGFINYCLLLFCCFMVTVSVNGYHAYEKEGHGSLAQLSRALPSIKCFMLGSKQCRWRICLMAMKFIVRGSFCERKKVYGHFTWASWLGFGVHCLRWREYAWSWIYATLNGKAMSLTVNYSWFSIFLRRSWWWDHDREATWMLRCNLT